MKIGLISPYAFSAVGGVQGQVAGLALALQQRGHSVSIAAPSISGPVAENLLQEGISLIDGGGVIAIPANGSVAPISLNPFAAIRVRRAFAKGNFDVIHCHEPLAPVLNYGVVLAPPAPIIATYHRAGGGRLMHLLSPIRPLFGRRFSKSFAVSQAAKGFAKFVTTADPIVVFNGMDLQALEAATPKALGDQSMFFLGRHEERKGLAVLLAAHEQLGEGILYIAGIGPETEQLQERFPESASRKWLGRLSDEDKYAYLRGATITCAPSLGGESFGVIVLEALAASSIAVISALPGYLEAAAGHAIEFPPGDVSGLTAALGSALLAAQSGEGVGSPAAREAGRAHGANWSMDRLAELYEAAYVEAIAERRR